MLQRREGLLKLQAQYEREAKMVFGPACLNREKEHMHSHAPESALYHGAGLGVSKSDRNLDYMHVSMSCICASNVY